MLAACARGAVASAQGAPNGEDRDAMPGTWRVPSPIAPRTLLALSLSGGYGWTEPVLDGRDAHHRVGGSIAIEFSAEGYQTQRRRATVRANGVVILNIDLRPAQRRPRR